MSVEKPDELNKMEFKPQPTEAEDIANRIVNEFSIMKNERDQTFKQFRNRTLGEYVDDAQKRFNYYKLKDPKKYKWQNNVFDPITHDKTIAILAGLAMRRFAVKIKPRFKRDFEHRVKANILTSIYEYTEEVQTKGDADHFFLSLQATVEGTAIGFEGWQKTTKKRKRPISANEETGEIEYNEVEETEEKVDARLVPLLNFYVGDLYEFDMDKQTKCIWRDTMEYHKFKEDWAGWRNV